MSKFACPKCGTASGYFTRRRVTLNTYFDPDGAAFDSEVTGDRIDTGNVKYCWDCKKNITAYVDKFQESEP